MSLKHLFDKTTVKFLIVGVINTAVGTAVMFVAYNVLHASYWLSSALNYIVGSIVSYVLNKYFTFQSTKKSIKEIIKFIVNISVCYLIAYGVAKPLVYAILSNFGTKVQDNVAMLTGMCLFIGLNYIGQRFFVFKSEEKK